MCHCPGFLAGSGFIRKADFILTHLPRWAVWYSFSVREAACLPSRWTERRACCPLCCSDSYRRLAWAVENLERHSLLWGQSFVLEFPGLCLSGVTSCTTTPVFRVCFLLGKSAVASHRALLLPEPSDTLPGALASGWGDALGQLCTPGSQQTAGSWKSLVTEKP